MDLLWDRRCGGEVVSPGDGGFANGEGEAVEVIVVWDFGGAELGNMGVVELGVEEGVSAFSQVCDEVGECDF